MLAGKLIAMPSKNTQYPTALTTEDFAANLARVQTRVAEAAQRVGRDPGEVRILPVSKTVPSERIRNAVAAGYSTLGENKVQEGLRKSGELHDLDVNWAVIGHLQTNKAKDVVTFASEFHALDSLRVAAALDRRLEMAGRTLDVYVQVNTSGEASKYGLHPDELLPTLKELPAFEHLRVRGLMTLAIFSSDQDRVRTCFQLLRDLRDRARDQDPALVGPGELSMGMSGDFETAIEEGANVVRIGQALFGERSTTDAMYWPRT